MEAIRKHRPIQAFLLALAAGAAMFLPFLIYDKGYFIYYGDFNVQQIPFYQLAHEAVRSGDVLWSWYTDLGANFIGSYSFYLLFSPFFWLTLPFPTAFLPHLMAPLLVLKTAFASLTACLYIGRFVRDTRYAVLGGLLYAFSGWMDFNIFFNHFHEAAVFFPLLLIGVEMLVQEGRHGPFLFAVTVNAAVNYWFFIGEAVFVVLYVFVRRTDKAWRLTLRKFLLIAAESVMGAGLAAVVLLPSVMALMGNWRTGVSELLTGWDVWLYWHEQRQPAILQSLFFPPERPARPNFFPDHGAKWASLSGWLPLVAMTGVMAYFWQRKNDWVKRLLTICLLFAMVPGLNSLFILLNDSYYARWFYMPILLMAVATVRALEDCGEDQTPFYRACFWSGIVLTVFTLMCGLTPNFDANETLQFGMAERPAVMWIYAAAAMVFLLITAVIALRLRRHRRFLTIMIAAVLTASTGFNIYYMAGAKNDRESSQWLIDHGIRGREKIDLPDVPFARADVYNSTDNIAMFWHLPNIQAFHSIVPPSIMDFYPAIGVPRDVGSRPEPEFYALRPFLSVRWLFIEEDKHDQDPMPDYTYYDTQNGFHIYENDLYLPMGFAYDVCADELELQDVSEKQRIKFMLRAVVLDDDAIERNRDLLRRTADRDFYQFERESVYKRDIAARAEFTADTFEPDRRGFTATTSFEQPKFLFFTVPWERGWTAELRVDGGAWEPLQIERANIGFMAVRVPAGNATIRFYYFTPGLKEGAAITAAFALLAAGYLLYWRRAAGRQREDFRLQRSMLSGYSVQLTWDEYMSAYSDPESRAARMQRVLNEAAARHKTEVLDESERTLRFTPPEDRQPGMPGEAGKPGQNGDNWENPGNTNP